MLSTELTNESGYVFLILDHQDMPLAGFHRLEHVLESIKMSFREDEYSRLRLDDRLSGGKSYSVLFLDRENLTKQDKYGPELRGTVLKLPMSSIPVGVIGL